MQAGFVCLESPAAMVIEQISRLSRSEFGTALRSPDASGLPLGMTTGVEIGFVSRIWVLGGREIGFVSHFWVGGSVAVGQIGFVS